MRYEVELTGWVDWQETGGSTGYEVVVLPLLYLVNLVVWLPHRALGRGYTLHVFDRGDRRVAKERYGTRGEALAAVERRRRGDGAAAG